MRTFTALKRFAKELWVRGVLFVAGVYVGGYLGGLQGLPPFLGTLGVPPDATDRALAVFTVLAIAAFPLVLVGAWYLRLSRDDPPQKTREDVEVPPAVDGEGDGTLPSGVGEPDATTATWRAAATVVSLALVLSVSTAIWLWLRLVPTAGVAPPDAPLDPNGVAILYPETVVGDEQTQQFADGLTARLITGLGEVRGLRVPPPAAVQPLRGAGLTPDSVARLLSVTSVVATRVESLGGQLRVTMTLIDGITGEIRGSVEVTDHRPDRFEIYDKVARSLLTDLRSELGRDLELRRSILGTDDPQAWELFKRGNERAADHVDLLALGDVSGATSSLLEADSLLAEAERTDPEYVEAMVRRGEFAETRALLMVPVDLDAHLAALDKAKGHAERALKTSPDYPQALALRGRVAFDQALSELESASRRRALLDSAWRDLSAALGGDPDPARVFRHMANVQAARGETADALQLARRAREYDAFLQVDDQLLGELFTLAFELGRDEEAAESCTEGRQRFPDNWVFLECRLWLMGWGSAPPDTATALAVRDSALALVPGEFRLGVAPWLQVLLAASFARTSDHATAHQMLTEATAHDMSGLGIAAAGVWLLLDDRERALGWVREYVKAVPAEANLIRGARVLAPLAGDPVFEQFAGPPGSR